MRTIRNFCKIRKIFSYPVRFFESRKRFIICSIIAAMACMLILHLRSRGYHAEAKAFELVDELRGYQPDWFDSRLTEYGFEHIIAEPPTPRDKSVVAEELVDMGHWAVPELLMHLPTSDDETRTIIVAILGDIDDDRSVESLIEMLNTKNNEVIHHAVISLGKIGDERAIPPLIKTLGNSNSPHIRLIAVDVLGKFGDSRVVPIFCGQANRASLSGLDWGLIDAQVQPYRISAIEYLGLFRDDRAVDALVKVLINRRNAPIIRSTAVISLGKIGNARAVGPLVEVLKEKIGRVDCSAAHALGNFSDPRAVESLIASLQSENAELRKVAAFALAKHGEKTITPLLIKLLDDKTPDVVGAAAYALGRIGDPRAVKPLIKTLKNWNGKSTQNSKISFIAEALGLLGNPQAGGALLEALGVCYHHYPSPSVSTYAYNLPDSSPLNFSIANALERIGHHEKLIDKLILILSDTTFLYHRDTAVTLLGEFPDDRAIEPLVKIAGGPSGIAIPIGISPSPSLSAAYALRRYDRKRVLKVFDEIFGKDTALGEIVLDIFGDPLMSFQSLDEHSPLPLDFLAYKKIIRGLWDGDSYWNEGGYHNPYPFDFDTVMEALVGMGSARAVRLIVLMLNDANEDVREAAFDSLVKIANQEVISQLEKISCGNYVPGLRQRADDALREIREKK